MSRHARLTVLVSTFWAVVIWSAIAPKDTLVWWLEASPALAAMGLLAVTYRRFPFSMVAYVCIWLHAIVLLVGAHYTYAEVPLGDWVRDWLDLDRNHYDRLGHIAQGLFPAIVTREVLLRTSPLRQGGWLVFLIACVCLAIAAFYEMIEWWTALLSDSEQGTAFLAMQGDIWDTQWDMFLALVGAVAGLLLLSRLHDRSMVEIGVHPEQGLR